MKTTVDRIAFILAARGRILLETRCALLHLILLSLCAGSCAKSPVSPADKGEEDFSLTISTVDKNGAPVGGLVISAWNHITEFPSPGANSTPFSLKKVAAVTTIGFQIPVTCHVILRAFDLDNELVETIVDIPGAVPGAHKANYGLQSTAGMRVFKFSLLATDGSTGALLYRDSIYAVLWQYDRTLSIIGTTSSQGTFQTADSLLFPNVLSLPPLVLTNSAGPTPLGTFQVSDSVTVVLSDTLSKTTQSYLCIITRGKNDIRLIWNPASISRPETADGEPTSPVTTGHSRKTQSAGLSWKLEQNYPNPFN